MTPRIGRRAGIAAVALVLCMIVSAPASLAGRNLAISDRYAVVTQASGMMKVAEDAMASVGPAASPTATASFAHQLQTLRVVRDLRRTRDSWSNPWKNALGATDVALRLSSLGLESTAPTVSAEKLNARRSLARIANDLDADVHSSDTRALLQAISRLPRERSAAVTRVLSAFATLLHVAATTYGGVSAQEVEDVRRRYLDPMHSDVRSTDVLPRMLADLGIDLSEVWHARTRFLATLPALARLQQSSGGPRACDAIVVAPVLALDTSGGDCVYKKHVALSIDLGGKDRYLNNAGGTNLENVGCSGWPAGAKGAAAAIDLAGDDDYGVTSEGRDCGFNGGGFYGIGMLLDASGDDSYVAGAVSANGAGSNFGLGLQIDAAGDDTYSARNFGTNGGSNAGIGFILDGAGDDRYIATDWGVNGGGYGGSGTIVDLAGSDTYESIRIGANGGAWLGSGHLIDLGDANDAYRAVESGANGGANLGTGFLFDSGGDDRYRAASSGVNGGAWGAGSGMLLDGGGNDLFHARHVAVNGGGGFNASGFLIDWGGNDRFLAGDLGANGGATFLGATGFLFDRAGDDAYEAGTRGANGGGDVGLATLIDLGGADTYRDDEGGTGRDKTVAPKGTVGSQVDRN